MGTQNVTVIKKVSIASEHVLVTFHFQCPYAKSHGNTENGLNYDDGFIPCHQLPTVVSEVLVGFAYLYGYCDSK